MTRVSVERCHFATLPDGSIVEQFTLTSQELKVSLITFGACVTNVILRANNLDVCPAYPDVKGYLENPFKMGATVGRVINRLANGRFRIDGQEFQVDKNYMGKHCIHGGSKDFVHYNWKVVEELLDHSSVTLMHVSNDGDMGFPGTLQVTAKFSLQGDEFGVQYRAETDAPTPVNLTCHCYFNLAGHSASRKELVKHTFQLNADRYLKVDQDFIPTREESVENTVFDLRQPTLLGDVIDSVNGGVAFDNYFCVSRSATDGIDWHARATLDDICLEMRSNQPGFQFYNNYYIDVDEGKEGCEYRRHSSFAFEAHNYPDAVNHPEFPNCVLRPGETYLNQITFKLYTL